MGICDHTLLCLRLKRLWVALRGVLNRALGGTPPPHSSSLIAYFGLLQLCSYAQEWANTLAHTNTFHYRNDCKDIGQNIYCRLSVKDPNEVAGQQVASYWYSACRHYDYLKEPDVQHASVNTGK